jgi:ATP-dependent RNA circularization protein (DNA/RNA ligase family)
MSLKDQSEDSIKNSLSEKYESEMVEILEELKKDENVGKAIDRIIEEAADLGEMQSKLILLTHLTQE